MRMGRPREGEIPEGLRDELKTRLKDDLTNTGSYRVISTVWHTGTHSLQEMFPDYRLIHCGPLATEMLNTKRASFITTYRDPISVAASWKNRGQLETEGHKERWRVQWDSWKEIIKRATVYPVDDIQHHLNRSPDNYQLIKSIEDENWEYYYSLIDKDLIEYARECTKEFREAWRQTQKSA